MLSSHVFMSMFFHSFILGLGDSVIATMGEQQKHRIQCVDTVWIQMSPPLCRLVLMTMCCTSPNTFSTLLLSVAHVTCE